ncbi:hypothetical protein C4577_00710 [Candidatus Parcubacteria bacterium]|nr:MAG: hypothetical protein C4577_00710 [Candidatus Parcubacteria bacterium]
MSIGKTSNFVSDLYMILSAYLNGFFLDSSYTFSSEDLKVAVDPIQKKVFIEAEDALLTVQNNRVTAFRESRDGKTLDYERLNNDVKEIIPSLLKDKSVNNYKVNVHVQTIKPNITTEEANDFGIVEMIGKGVSHFKGSIPNRIYNISLAASRLNGIIVAPGENFSFNKTIGDISSYTGYKQAYVIKDGRTVLGDGGGVCQVSTTIFRAALNAGLPIVERHAHSYRVSYYEQGSGPGIDATVYYPTEDFKFKNDTGNHILIQVVIDPIDQRLEFLFYGKKDGRETTITTPIVSSQTPAPPPLYQDDPALSKGVIKQIDYEAVGAIVSFKRIVKNNGKTIISETFTSRYSPWQAIFLRGTKE